MPKIRIEATGLPVAVIKAIGEGKDPSQIPQASRFRNWVVVELISTLGGTPAAALLDAVQTPAEGLGPRQSLR